MARDGDASRDGSAFRGGETLAFATFHATTLVVVGVLVVHRYAALGDLLTGLNTLAGLAAFAFLWALSWLATRRVLATVALEDAADGGGKQAVLRGLAWGGITGALFFLGVVVALLPRVLLADVLAQPLSVLLLVLIGVGISLVVGMVVGLLFAVVDVALVRVAAAIAPEPL